jgi:hypothetical protein
MQGPPSDDRRGERNQGNQDFRSGRTRKEALEFSALSLSLLALAPAVLDVVVVFAEADAWSR